MRVKQVSILMLGLVGGSAYALDLDPSFAFSGFGTVGLAQTNSNLGDFVSPNQHRGATKSASFAPDTNLGGQVNMKLNSTFSGTLQVLSKEDGNDSYRPQVEWAFLKAQVLPSLAVRVGRMGTPYFMVSDFRNVNYSNVWVRPPEDVYGQAPISHFEGADTTYQANVGPGTVTAQVFYGKANTVSDTTPIHVSHQIGYNLTAEFDNGLSLRIGRANSSLTVDRPDITALGQTLTGYGFPDVGAEVDPIDKRASFTGLGIGLDRGNWVSSFEYTRRRTKSFVPNTTGWALTVGYRIEKFTPYIVDSRLRDDGNAIVNTIPAPYAPLPQYVDALINGYDPSQKTISAGLRWDVATNYALKTQFDRITPGINGGQFVNQQPGLGNSTVNVYSVSLDFVF